jgi:hypothetical protein
VLHAARTLVLCSLLFLAACGDRGLPSAIPGDPANRTIAVDLQLEPAPTWMEGYCRKAADDLGYPVLCPLKLPPLLDVVPCRGPAPEEELRGEYCFDYVLDVLFRGPPAYRGPFGGKSRRTGHLAIWTIASTSDLHPDGLYGCPGGGRKQSAHWWTCPENGGGANLNSGHVAFQWSVDGLLYGLSVHGVSGINRQLVRELLDQLHLVGPRSD